MYMNQNPNKRKRTSFNPTTMTSLGFIALSQKNYVFAQVTPSKLFWSEFFGPLLKLGGNMLQCQHYIFPNN